MAETFFFYDLETSGIDPRHQRVMQFAGQRTDLDMQPIGEPFNIVIKLAPDVVPDPEAILLTGITPQSTLQDGVTEAEFLERFSQEIATAGTIFVGYNTIRFDDEFMRYMHYRNFYDAYEWQWAEGRSKWDMLDVARMTRALRPEGISWPLDAAGKPSNKLELLTGANGLDHQAAHDALSDVQATIGLARLLRAKQPKLFSYLLKMRSKKAVAELVETGEAFVHSSGRYPSEYEKTATVVTVAKHPTKQAVFVYDLRHNPAGYADKSAQELAELWKWKKDKNQPTLPVKLLQYNHCPAVAPLGVLDQASQQRLKIDIQQVSSHANQLKQMIASGFADKLTKAAELLEQGREQRFKSEAKAVDAQLYDGFVDNYDRNLLRALRVAEPDQFGSIAKDFHDRRLKDLLPLYKARNFPDQLSGEERTAWEEHRQKWLMDGGDSGRLARFFLRLGQLAESSELTTDKQFLLEELQLYGQSILPADLGEAH